MDFPWISGEAAGAADKKCGGVWGGREPPPRISRPGSLGRVPSRVPGSVPGSALDRVFGNVFENVFGNVIDSVIGRCFC